MTNIEITEGVIRGTAQGSSVEFFLNDNIRIKVPVVQGQFRFDLTPFMNGEDITVRVPVHPVAKTTDFLDRTQDRWKDHEGDVGLTWGRMMTGDSFADAMNSVRPIQASDSITEIGPGYGRILSSLLERKTVFDSYIGCDVSDMKVSNLRSKFRESNVLFSVVDAIRDPLPEAHVTICAATMEHFFPDFGNVLAKIMGYSFCDFVMEDDDWKHSFVHYDEIARTYGRIYSENEIKAIYAKHGHELLAFHSITIGKDELDRPVRRIFVAAKKD